MVSRFRLARTITDSGVTREQAFLSPVSLAFANLDAVRASELLAVPVIPPVVPVSSLRVRDPSGASVPTWPASVVRHPLARVAPATGGVVMSATAEA